MNDINVWNMCVSMLVCTYIYIYMNDIHVWNICVSMLVYTYIYICNIFYVLLSMIHVDLYRIYNKLTNLHHGFCSYYFSLLHHLEAWSFYFYDYCLSYCAYYLFLILYDALLHCIL